MSTETSSRATTERRREWAEGLALFAGAMMLVGGIFHVLAGIAGLVNDKVYVTTPDYLYAFDLTGWGWAHLLVGVVVGATGVAVIQGQAWGRAVGIALVCVSLIANFLFIPYFPIWSLVIIALDVAIIWALAVGGRTTA